MIDAVIVPANYARASTFRGQLEQYATEFGPVLGHPEQIHASEMLDGRWFLRARAEDTVKYPDNSPMAGRHRYEWRPRDENDGVLYGVKLPCE